MRRDGTTEGTGLDVREEPLEIPHISARTKRNGIVLLCIFLFAEVGLRVLPTVGNALPQVLYIALTAGWCSTVRRRVTHPMLRRRIVVCAYLLIVLFFLTAIRYGAPKDGWVFEIIWHLFFIPTTLIPLVMLDGVINADDTLGSGPSRTPRALWAAWAFLMVCILASCPRVEALGFPAEIRAAFESMFVVSRYLAYVWEVAVAVVAFVLLVRRCRNSQCRRLWFYPVIPTLLFFVLMLIYLANGSSSPVIFGYKAYNMQEIYMMLVFCPVEGCIQIGLIPSNTDYEELFGLTGLDTVILDAQGTVVHQTEGFPLDSPEVAEALTALSHGDGDLVALRGDPSRRMRSQPVSGGKAIWIDDLSVITQLNEELLDMTEQIEEENVLLEEENRVIEERTRYETRNRLYDTTSLVLGHQLERLESLSSAGGNPDLDERQRLARCAVLLAYVKRRANLVLLAQQEQTLDFSDLALCIRESFEHLEPLGINCGLGEIGEKSAPSALVILAYELFEQVVESTVSSATLFFASVGARSGIALTLEVDARPSIAATWRADEISALGARLEVFFEGDICYIRLWHEGRAAT